MSDGWNSATPPTTARMTLAPASRPRAGKKRPTAANVIARLPSARATVSGICPNPCSITASDRTKIANDIRTMGRQIFSAANIVAMNDDSAMRDATAAVSDVGGDSSPQTAMRNAKKWATQGLTPHWISGGTMITATTT